MCVNVVFLYEQFLPRHIHVVGASVLLWGSFVLSWVRLRLCGCIRFLVGASFLLWVHHLFNACIGLVVGVLVLSWVHWSCRGCIGLVVGAMVLSSGHCCHRCMITSNQPYRSVAASFNSRVHKKRIRSTAQLTGEFSHIYLFNYSIENLCN